jgi:hypothetical protein
LAAALDASPLLTRFTASSPDSVVYSCFGILFIVSLSKVTLILRHPWKAIFRGKVNGNLLFFGVFYSRKSGRLLGRE